MQKFLLPFFLSLVLIGSPILVSTSLVATVEGQLLPCGPTTPDTSPCLNLDGTTRPATSPGGGQQDPPGGGQEDPPGGGDPAEANRIKNCEDIIAEMGSIQAEEEASIVPCGRAVHQCEGATPGNEQCEFKHLFVLVNNLVKNFITKVFAPLLVIVLTYVGFLFIRDKAAAKTKAKELLMKVLIGTFFVLAAWLIVNFILNALGAENGLTKFINEN